MPFPIDTLMKLQIIYKLRDLKIEERNSPEADIAQWEIDFISTLL
jgi:hypothetical protein